MGKKVTGMHLSCIAFEDYCGNTQMVKFRAEGLSHLIGGALFQG